VAAREIEVEIRPEFRDHVADEWIVRLVEAVCDAEGAPQDVGVTVVVTDDAEIQALNRDYRGVDAPTDVLAFDEAGLGFVAPEDLPPYLGDVVVSYPTAAQQAAEQGHAVQQELALLVVHGCLHLLGYDHEKEADQQRMWARQEEILSSLSKHLPEVPD